MSYDEPIESRQDNEFSSLLAMYMDEVQDLRIQNNSWVPLNFKISLVPQRGGSGLQEINSRLVLHVKCSKKYPFEPPTLRFENSKGLSTLELNQLEKQLNELSTRLAENGLEMIYQLVQHVESFLYENNKPATKSFYEEMILRQKQEELREREARKLEEEMERQVIFNEMQKRKECEKHEKKNSDNQPETNNLNRRRTSSNYKQRKYSIDDSEEIACEHNGIQTIIFPINGERIIQRGRCINHSNRNCVVYSGMDTNTGHMVIISQWVITHKNSDLANINKLITSIEQEFNYLVKLKHPNLAHYLSLKHEYIYEDNQTVVYVMREFVYGSNCTALFTCESMPGEIDRIKHIASGVLTALDFLHRNNIVHKDIRESCIYINKRGTVKIANYSIDRRLTDFTNQYHPSNYGKKTDIYKFGIFLITILTGVSITEAEPVIPHTIPSDFYDFLTKCLTKTDRYTTSELLDHSFLRASVDRLSPRFTSEEVRQQGNSSPEPPAAELIAHNTSLGQSRVYNEFEVLDCVGKGAFGEVFKVRNKLDQRIYAIKRIILNPKEVANYKRLFREVKYLSRLNHENVVRYYNSWIEKCTTPVGTILSPVSTTPSLPNVIQQKTQELSCYADIEKFAPPATSFKSEAKDASQSLSSEDSDSSDDEDEDWKVIGSKDSSSSVEFLQDGETSESVSEVLNTNENKSQLPTIASREFQLMYIQMEFCEKSTLRTAIDDGLHKDVDRMLRLFREIVEGLAHIHQQTLIHRDLKPVNIFLDSNDNVKIGDFGLATTYFLSKATDNVNYAKSLVENFEEGSHETDGTLTGQIGTALYIAPEIATLGKVSYSTKVDVYSLGIIFFEMCYKPIHTHMERINILKQLRTKEIIFPEDFIKPENEKNIEIIRWLLDHNVEKRPTSLELLQSDYIPPPVLEERELREIVKTTLNNPQLKAYKYLIESCFKQAITPAQDIMYSNFQPSTNTTRNLYTHARKKIIKIFNLHGGHHIDTPLLMPKNKQFEGIDSTVNLMTHSGSIVSLPHDLRVPFARYIAWNSITLLRRYSIERVYREKKVFDSQPRELFECSFDIVTPTPGNYMSDAEVLYILNEIINSFPALKGKEFTIYLNHFSLLKAIFWHCGIKENHEEIFNILADVKGAKVTKLHIKTRLASIGLSDKTISLLGGYLEEEGSILDVTSNLQTITRKKDSEASQLAIQALQELKIIHQNSQALAVKFPIVLSLGLVHNNIHQYSGMTCHLVCRQVKKKNKHGLEVLAAGGRYDSLISSYRKIIEKGSPVNKGLKQSAVGISVSLDKLVQMLIKEQCMEIESLSSLDVGICSLGSKALLKEKAKILVDLWTHDIRCSLIDATTLQDVDELNYSHTILVKDSDDCSIIIRSKERDRYHDKRLSTLDLIDYMQRITKYNQENFGDPASQSNNLARSESKSNTEREHEFNCSIMFETTDRISANVRRRYEHQIRAQIEGSLKKIQGEVVVIAINLDSNVIRSLVSYLEFDSDETYEKSTEQIIERHVRHKKYLRDVCELIFVQKTKQSSPIIALFSLPDLFYKFIV